MAIYLQGPSALEHYRSDGIDLDFMQDQDAFDLEDAESSLAAARDARVYRAGVREGTAEHPLHVLVRRKEQRAGSIAITPRVWGSSLPRDAFLCVRKDLYVSSPEFLFLQMARNLELPELVALGMELCGSYRRSVPAHRLGEEGYDFFTVYQVPSITTPAKLRKFLGRMDGAEGVNKALKALVYVLPDSASPMETAIYLLLCLPRRLGGYALPQPTLNPSIKINRSGLRYTVRMSARPDLYWENAKLDVEYLGDDFHTNDNRSSDSMRRKALEHMHIEVIELTKEEVNDVDIFHAIAMRITKSLGKRMRYDAVARFASRRSYLRMLLLSDGEEGEVPHSSDVHLRGNTDEIDQRVLEDLQGDFEWHVDDRGSASMDESDAGRVFGAGIADE